MVTIEVFKLFGSILVDSSKAEDSLSKTEGKAEGLAKKLGGGIKTAAKWGIGIAAAAGVVGGAMMGAANKVAGAADEVDKSSRRAGTSAENWQKLNYAFGQSGIESSKLEQTMIKNQKALNDAAEGGKKATEAYGKLGVSIKDSNGKLRNSDAVYRDVLNNLADLEDKNLRNSIANDIFGKSYGDLAPILDGGSQGIEDLTSRAEELGLVLSQDTVDAGVKFGDTLDDVKQAGGALFNQIAAKLLPIVQKLLDWVIAHLPEIQSFVNKAFNVIKGAVETGITVFNALKPVLKVLYDFVAWAFPIIKDVVTTVFGAITPIVEGVAKAFETVTGAIKTAVDWISSWNDKKVNDKKVKVEEERPGGGSQYKPPQNLKASGLAYVPYDGYEAVLHKGERILSRGEVMGGMMQHSGTIRVEGINSAGDLVAVSKLILDDLARQQRRNR